MPTPSPFPDVDIPNVDLWSFMFQRETKPFPDTQVIYRSIDSRRHYTFADVRAAATSFGEGLQNLWDWQRGDILAVYAPNDIDFAPLVYGVFFAGGVVSPANPGYSAEELAFQLENAGAKGLATTKAFLPSAIEAAKKAGVAEDRIILIGEERDDTHRVKHWSNIRKTSGAARYRRRKMTKPAEDLAFLVYSSGTTGLPKGVMLTHTNVISCLCLINGTVGQSYGPSDKILGVLPFFHIYGLQGLVQQALHRGIEMVVMPAFDMKVFLETIQRHKITFIYVAPPVIVRLARDKQVADYDLSSVRMITSGAAPLSKELVEAVYKRTRIRINQAYGLSETSPMTHTQLWDEWYDSVGSVGKLFPNMRAKYVDAEGAEVGTGEVGELWLAGPNIFKGYWRNPTATADSIATDAAGHRYFKTGDVGYQDRGDNFYITDRVKELIKYKGFQVAPAELEGKLMDHPLVNDVAVIGVYDRWNETEVPRAYVVHRDGGEGGTGDAEDIVGWWAKKAAGHKRLRGGVRFVSEVPKSASGKILRRVLKEWAKKEEEEGGKPKAKL